MQKYAKMPILSSLLASIVLNEFNEVKSCEENVKSCEKMGYVSDLRHVRQRQVLKSQQPNKPVALMPVINVNRRTKVKSHCY